MSTPPFVYEGYSIKKAKKICLLLFFLYFLLFYGLFWTDALGINLSDFIFSAIIAAFFSGTNYFIYSKLIKASKFPTKVLLDDKHIKVEYGTFFEEKDLSEITEVEFNLFNWELIVHFSNHSIYISKVKNFFSLIKELRNMRKDIFSIRYNKRKAIFITFVIVFIGYFYVIKRNLSLMDMYYLNASLFLFIGIFFIGISFLKDDNPYKRMILGRTSGALIRVLNKIIIAIALFCFMVSYSEYSEAKVIRKQTDMIKNCVKLDFEACKSIQSEIVYRIIKPELDQFKDFTKITCKLDIFDWCDNSDSN